MFCVSQDKLFVYTDVVVLLCELLLCTFPDILYGMFQDVFYGFTTDTEVTDTVQMCERRRIMIKHKCNSK